MTSTHPEPREVEQYGILDAAADLASLPEDEPAQTEEPAPDPKPDAQPPEEAASEEEPEEGEEADETEADEEDTEEESESDAEEEAADDEEEEEPDDPAIAPPASMSAEDKAAFEKLPREQQQWIVTREKQRDAEFTRKSQEVADSRKKAQSELQQAAQERNWYKEGLRVLGEQLKAAAQPISQEKLEQLRETDPAKWAQANEINRQARERQGAIQQELQRLDHGERQKMLQERQQYLQENARKLPDLIPEWADQTKAAAEKRELADYLVNSAGFSRQEVNEAADARLVAMARKAMRYDQLQASKPAVTKKVRKAPKSIKPSAAKPRQAEASMNRERLSKRLNKSGSLRDAAALVESLE